MRLFRRRGLQTTTAPVVSPGSAPGVIRVDENEAEPRIRLLGYNKETFEEAEDSDLETIPDWLDKWSVTWVHVSGYGNADKLKRLGELLQLHALALEDVVNGGQRPKVEEFEQSLFIVAQALGDDDALPCEQVNLFLGDRFVVTFERRPSSRWEAVRERIRRRRPRICSRGPDYLVYALLDYVVDHFFPLAETFVERAEALEDEAVNRPEQATVLRISELKHGLAELRRVVRPLRETLANLTRDDHELINDKTRPFLRDCLDHATQLTELSEAARDMAGGLMNIYLSIVSNKTNEVMRVLTIIATLFIPLTFVAGIYGMNFNPEKSPYNMPELAWTWGYPFALVVMAVIAIALLFFFRRKGWLGARRSD